jgi:hypothetical protein
MRGFDVWLNSATSSPAEMSLKNRLRQLLGKVREFSRSYISNRGNWIRSWLSSIETAN